MTSDTSRRLSAIEAEQRGHAEAHRRVGNALEDLGDRIGRLERLLGARRRVERLEAGDRIAEERDRRRRAVLESWP